jgi:ABC-type multidrug transport system fused ATPase/permease subunit
VYKRDIINFLFVTSFTIFGIGNYIVDARSPSVGLVIASFPYVAIIGFFVVDMLYRKSFPLRVKGNVYFLMLLFLLSTVASIFISLFRGYPTLSFNVAVGNAIAILTPFHAFLIVAWYNRNEPDGTFIRLMVTGLLIMLAVNVVGYAGGLSNQGHHMEGRLNLPFFGGLYAASSLMIFMNILFIRQIKRNVIRVTQWWWKIPVIMCNLFMIYLINSRLTMMLFLMVLGLMFFNIVRSRVVYWVSLFTIPIVLSLRLLVYEIVSSSFFAGIMQRVDFEDVTSFNGRAYIWGIGMNWLLVDQRGLLFGNGMGGQYFIGLLEFYARLFSGGKSDLLHFHSSSLEIVVNQGLFGFFLYAALLYHVFMFFRNKYVNNEPDGDVYPSIVFLLFLLQIDTFVYMTGLGAILLAALVARVCIRQPSRPKAETSEKVLAMEVA